MGIAYQGDRFSGKQVNPGQQRNSSQTFVLIITENFPVFQSRAQVILSICNCLYARFFIIRYSDCKLIIIRYNNLPIFVKL